MTARPLVAFSVAAASAFVLSLAATDARAAGAAYRTQQEVCLQHIKDAQEARSINPVIGDKAAATFDKLITEAQRLCEAQQYAEAEKVVNTAKGMVASE